MDKAKELSQLRDIHLPEPIGWWPPAPGWYFLAILILVALIVAIIFLTRHYLNGRARRQALRLLETYQQQYLEHHINHQLIAARLSELLKRVALVYFPREKVASLQGESWIAFLNDTGKGLNFNAVQRELLELPYQSEVACDFQPLFGLVRTWIRQRRGQCLN